eukprot:Phypoly_transcript_24520.p1 GENE.Phypoly_transcript_24520~~Phypoly_transcript_24520.p1  ORF type:complete len:158 (+),score=25.02 Phypoly_transcript_24520:67-540(+)
MAAQEDEDAVMHEGEPYDEGDNGEEDEEDVEYFEEDDEDYELSDPSLYKFVKRVPQRLPTKKNDIYVSRKTKYFFQYKRAKKLLDDGEPEVMIHGLGAAVKRAIQLALKLTSELGVSMGATTSTVELLDEYQPLVDDLPPRTKIRYNSAIHIRVFKT